MRISLQTILETYDKRLMAYSTLLELRYHNICPKADAISLLNVEVEVTGDSYDIENVAQVYEYEWNQLLVVPTSIHLFPDILKAVMKKHPEFKFAMHSMDGTDDEEAQAILYTMPKVDNDRRDILTKAVDTLYDEIATIMQGEYKKGKAEIDLKSAEIQATDEDKDEAQQQMDKAYNNYIDHINKLHEQKLADIEYAYQQYLLEENEGQAEAQSEAEDMDVATSMQF